LNLADNTRDLVFTLQAPVHDLALTQLLAPAMTLPNNSTNLTLTIVNQGNFQEVVSVTVDDLTDNRSIANFTIPALPAAATTNRFIPWQTTGASIGAHQLRAQAAPVTGETILANNQLSLSAIVAPGLTTNLLLATGSRWRYWDQGMDLTATPWRELSYYDATWPEGPAPLGYSDNGQHTNIATKVSYGPSASTKYTTTYFRTRFYADAVPITLSGRLRRDDGVILYLNGHEFYRNNMSSNATTFSTFATNTVSGTDQYTYLSFTANPTNVVVGENCVAAEVHQVNLTSSDIVMDLELKSVTPRMPVVHDVAMVQTQLPESVVAGDRARIGVTLTNRGTATESFTVVLQNNSQPPLWVSQTINSLLPGEVQTVWLEWPSLNATGTSQSLQVFAISGGVTNALGAISSPLILEPAFETNVNNITASLGGRCSTVAVQGNQLWVGAGATLQVYDRTDANQPVQVGSIRLPGLIQSLAGTNAVAFAACGPMGVAIVDLANPSAPVNRTSIKSAGHSSGLALLNQYLLIADGIAGLRVVDIRQIDAPKVVGVYPTEGAATAVKIAGTTAYVLDDHRGLLLLDLSNPSAPTLLSTLPMDVGNALAVSGSLAVAVDAAQRLHFYNVSNPRTPTRAATWLATNQIARSLAIQGTTVLLGVEANAILSLNASTPASPILNGSIPLPGPALDLALDATTFYAASGYAGFDVLNNMGVGLPQIVAHYSISQRGVDAALAQGLAAVAGGEAGVRIYSITNLAAPRWLSTYTNLTFARGVALRDSILFVADGLQGFKVLDISAPAQPALLGQLALPDLDGIRRLAVEGQFLVATDGRKIDLVSIANPAQPQLLSSYTPPGFVLGLTLANSQVFAACGARGLVILSTASGALAYLGGFDSPGIATGVSVANSKAYLADGARGWTILDISQPSAPILISTSTNQGTVYDIAAAGPLAVMANGANSVSAVNVLTPISPASFGPLVRALRLVASGPLALTAEDEAGLSLMALPNNDLDGDGLPDDWEMQIVNANLNDDIRTIADVRPGDDFDGDGVSNYMEYLASTSPTDPASLFMVSTISTGTSSGSVLQWHSVAGKSYTVYKSTDLGAGFVALERNIPGTPPLNQFTDPTPASQAFYIISVQQ
jgi:hypothetical protein